MTYINRADVVTYVARCMPDEDLADFNLDGIADELLAAHPEVIGEHDLMGDPRIGTRRMDIDEYLDATFAVESDAFWDIVARYDVSA